MGEYRGPAPGGNRRLHARPIRRPHRTGPRRAADRNAARGGHRPGIGDHPETRVGSPARCLLAAQRHLHAQGSPPGRTPSSGSTWDIRTRCRCTGPGRQRRLTGRWNSRCGGTSGARATRRPGAAVEAPPAGLSANSVKIMVDGIVENRSAALHQPYLTPVGPPIPARRSLSRRSRRGGRGCRRRRIRGPPPRDRRSCGHRCARRQAALPEADASPEGTRARADVGRHHIAHLQLVAPQDIPRFAALGMTANMQMLWAAEDDQVQELCRPLLGDAGSISSTPSLLCWPPALPGDGIGLAGVDARRTRSDPGRRDPPAGRTPGPPPAGHRAGAHRRGRGAGRHHRRRTVARPGRPTPARPRADLVALDRDIYRIPAGEIASTEVITTVAGGRVVHRH